MRHEWWLSWLFPGKRPATVSYTTVDGVIVEAAPLIRRFIGQPRAALMRWVSRFDGVIDVCLSHEKER